MRLTESGSTSGGGRVHGTAPPCGADDEGGNQCAADAAELNGAEADLAHCIANGEHEE